MIWFKLRKFAIEHNFLTCIFICLIVFSISAMIIYRDDIFRVKGSTEKKHYEINDIIKVNITNEEVMYFYLNDFLNTCSESVSKCYSLLSDDYKAYAYPSEKSFEKFINDDKDNVFLNPTIVKYAVKNSNNKKYIYAESVDNQYYIFEIESIFKYKVYLDYLFY